MSECKFASQDETPGLRWVKMMSPPNGLARVLGKTGEGESKLPGSLIQGPGPGGSDLTVLKHSNAPTTKAARRDSGHAYRQKYTRTNQAGWQQVCVRERVCVCVCVSRTTSTARRGRAVQCRAGQGK